MDSKSEEPIKDPPKNQSKDNTKDSSTETEPKPQTQIILKPYIFKCREFNNFKDAFQFYKIDPKSFHIKIIYTPTSLESVYNNGNFVDIIGEGIKSSPGYPSGNQNLDKQMKLINHFKTVGTIDVLYMNRYKKVIYMGRYGFLSYKKKLSFSGFCYFLFTLNSYQPRDRYKVFVKPNISITD